MRRLYCLRRVVVDVASYSAVPSSFVGAYNSVQGGYNPYSYVRHQRSFTGLVSEEPHA